MENTKQITVGNKRLQISKWKAKHKKIFKKMFTDDISEKEVLEELVYNCIDKEVVLSPDEFKYILCQIRSFTLGEDITFNLHCDACNKNHTQTFKISDLIKYNYKELNKITVSNVDIDLGEIKNKDFYMQMLEELPDNANIVDFALRIKSINGDDSMSFNEVLDFLDNLDLDIYEKILNIWEENKFKIIDVNEVTCPHCSDIQKYEFDDLPGFFPDDWLIEK